MVGDSIFGVIQVNTLRLGGHSFSARWVARKEIPQMQFANPLAVGIESLPGCAPDVLSSGHRMCVRGHSNSPFLTPT